jgi:hypothetical protein
VCDEAAAADKEAMAEVAVKRAMEEATKKKATEEAAVKAVAAEATGAAGASPAPSHVPPAAGAKRSVAPSGSISPAKRPYRGVWKPQFVQLSPHLLFPYFLTTFLSRSASSGAAAVTSAAAADAVVMVALGPAPDSEPRTPEGDPEDVVESEGELEVAPEVVPAVVQEEAPAEGDMITVCTAVAPPPSHGAHAPLSSVPCRAVTSGAAISEGMAVVLGHPPFTRRVTSP